MGFGLCLAAVAAKEKRGEEKKTEETGKLPDFPVGNACCFLLSCITNNVVSWAICSFDNWSTAFG